MRIIAFLWGVILILFLTGCCRYNPSCLQDRFIENVTEKGIELKLNLTPNMEWVYDYQQETTIITTVLDTTFTIPQKKNMTLVLKANQQTTEGTQASLTANINQQKLLLPLILTETGGVTIVDDTTKISKTRIELGETIQNLIDFLPLQPVQLGESWVVDKFLYTASSNQNIPLTLTYTLTDVFFENDEPRLLIAVKGQLNETISNQEKNNEITITTDGTIEGLIIFEPDSGRILKKEVQSMQQIKSISSDSISTEIAVVKLETQTTIQAVF